ncbi:PspC domain-containing protein [Flavobacterium sp. NKUCC04_CG]|uniref:PspC domain-containing protein n=1 Tax=Flavobacterium sp. NKUCC04_CG TaxID=2842121 RepID=UPI001C5AB23E|nr:PspC domain-containing protein [Flavobacterium sp. NKUCC04_CG]MBW3519401.1 PspC domain-containing protein [Flavobacterium sp. NKUCC04_CG]
MNKTVTVNIAGIIFHIDENAYNKLNHYLQAIRNSINMEGREEIIHDIESRIAELFSERIDANNQVIILTDVDSIIQIMGEPEAYRIDDEEPHTYSQPHTSNTFSRKLYRDTDKRVLGGVLAGLGHYFRIDPVWLRILLLILVFFYGTGVLVYIILWIVIPKASSTSEKLEMKGEPINISSIEKKVRENIDYVSDKVNNIDYQKVGQNIGKNTLAFGDSAAQILRRIFGIGFLIFAFFGFLGSAVAGIVVSNNKWHFPQGGAFEFTPGDFALSTPLWVMGLIIFLISAIPFIILFLLGLKLLYKNLKYVGLTSIILAGLWFFAIIGLIFITMQEAGNNSKFLSTAINKELNIGDEFFSSSTDLIINNQPLEILFVDDKYFQSATKNVDEFKTTLNSGQKTIELELLETYQEKPYLTVQLEARKKDLLHTESAEQATPAYNFEIKENTLILSDNFIPKDNDQYIVKKIKLYLYLSENTSVRLNSDFQALMDDDFVLQPGVHVYKIINQDFTCVDCK